MPVTVRASGAAELRALSRDLKEAGRKDLRKELFAGLNRGTKPLRADIKANALATLPSSGGLAARAAASNITVRGGGARVTIVARPSKRGGQFDPDRLNAGAVKHLTYGHAPLVDQRVTPGWFNKPIIAGQDDVVRELLEGIEEVARKLAAG